MDKNNFKPVSSWQEKKKSSNKFRFSPPPLFLNKIIIIIISNCKKNLMMRTWLCFNIFLTTFVLSLNFVIIVESKVATTKTSHLSSGFLIQRTISINQKPCSCRNLFSCSCCQSIDVILRGVRRNFCINFNYSLTGLSMNITMGLQLVRLVNIIDYRAFKVCTAIPDCPHSFACIEVTELSQFPRSITICVQLDITSKIKNWLINYNCISVSTILSNNSIVLPPITMMPQLQPTTVNIVLNGSNSMNGMQPMGMPGNGQMQPGQMQAGQMQPGQMQPGQMQAGQMMQPGQMQPGQMQPGQMQAGQMMQPGQMQPGQMQPGQMQAGQMQPGQMQPGQMQAGQMMQPGQMQAGQMMQPGQMQAGQMQPGQMQAGQMMQPGQMQAGQMQPGQMQPGQMQPGQMQPGQMQAGQMMQPGQMQPGQMQPGQMQPGQMQAGQMQPGQMQPGQMQPGQTQAGQMMQPGQMQPGQMQPGQIQPGEFEALFTGGKLRNFKKFPRFLNRISSKQSRELRSMVRTKVQNRIKMRRLKRDDRNAREIKKVHDSSSSMKMQVILRRRKNRLPKIKLMDNNFRVPKSGSKIVNQDTKSIPMSTLVSGNNTWTFDSSSSKDGLQLSTIENQMQFIPVSTSIEEPNTSSIFLINYDNRTSSFPNRMPPGFAIASRIGPDNKVNESIDFYERSFGVLEIVKPENRFGHDDSEIIQFSTTDDGRIIFPE